MNWEDIREMRLESLLKMDRYQLVMVYDTLTDTQKQELINFRQTLLDLPQDYDTADEAYTNYPDRPSWMWM